MDELDALPDRRLLRPEVASGGPSIVALALTLFDGAATSRDGIVLIGATNHGDRLDPALVRAGRFERIIDVPLPGVDDLAAILNSISARRCRAPTCCRSRGSGLALRRPTPPVGPATRAPSPGQRAAK